MSFEDINETLFSKLDPETQRTLIDAQVEMEMLSNISLIVFAAIIILFWVYAIKKSTE